MNMETLVPTKIPRPDKDEEGWAQWPPGGTVRPQSRNLKRPEWAGKTPLGHQKTPLWICV